MPKAAIYTRLSQDRDGSKGGTDRQEKDCRELCKREGLTVVRVYRDDDTSAYNGKRRPDFEQMLADLGDLDVVVYWRTDRLVRRFAQFADVLAACETASVRLVSVLDPIDTSTPIGKGVAGMLAAVGEQESANTATRVRRKQADDAQRGRPHGGARPFGYESGGVQICTPEARAIRDARDRLFRGESMTSICNLWNQRGPRPVRATQWRVATFKRLMTGPRLAALRQYQGEVVADAAWPPIISVEDHERLVALLTGGTLDKPRRTVRPGGYLTTGLIYCSRCGCRLRSSVRESGSRRWECRRQPGEPDNCGRLAVVAEPVDELVEASIVKVLSDARRLARLLREPASTKKQATVAQVSDLERRIVQLGVDHDEGVINRREWLERRRLLEDRLTETRADLVIESGASPLHAFVGVHSVHNVWDRLDMGGRRRVAAALINRIVILAPVTRVTRFDTGRVDIDWRA